MPTLPDSELLRRYAVDQTEDAFAELVSRHVDLVYSAALRQVGADGHHAEDVSQAVFTELAQRASRLVQHPSLPGWLYTTTRLMAARARRTEKRRLVRELESHAMNAIESNPPSETNWEELRPLLDDVMHELDDKDRTVVLLRYFKNQSLKEVGDAIGLGDNAARMRVDRALEKLRAVLARRGIKTTGTFLAGALSANTVLSAPAGLVNTVTTASLAAVGAATASGIGVIKLMLSGKTAAIGAVGIVVLTGWLAVIIYTPGSKRTETASSIATTSQKANVLRSTNRFFALPGTGVRTATNPSLTAALPPEQQASFWGPQLLRGQVLDANTGMPISKFRITLGSSSDYRISPTFRPYYPSAKEFMSSKGRFSLEFNLKGTIPVDANAIEVAADDYSDAIHILRREQDGLMQLLVKLKPAAPLVGVVVTADGRPAPGVDLLIVDAKKGDVTPLARLKPGGLVYMEPETPTHTSDLSGQFRFRSPPESGRIVAAGNDGFASVSIEQVRATGRLVLQRFGRIEGVLRVAGEPAVLQELSFSFWNAGIDTDFEGYKVRTDTEGQFIFAMVPSGQGSIERLTPTSATSWSIRRLTEVTVESGQTNCLTLGEADIVLRGIVRFQSSLPSDTEVTTTATLSIPYPQMPAGMTPEEVRTFRQSPEWRERLKKWRSFSAPVGNDGRFVLEAIPSGEYTLQVKAVRGKQDPIFSQRYGGANTLLAQGEARITVPPDSVPTAPIDIGEIILKPVDIQPAK